MMDGNDFTRTQRAHARADKKWGLVGLGHILRANCHLNDLSSIPARQLNPIVHEALGESMHVVRLLFLLCDAEKNCIFIAPFAARASIANLGWVTLLRAGVGSSFLAWRSHLLSCLKPTPHGPTTRTYPLFAHSKLAFQSWPLRVGGRQGNGGNKRRVIQPLQDAPGVM